MEKLPNNSDAYRERTSATPVKKEVVPVVRGSVKTKKRGGLRELTDGFIQEDVSTVRNSIWNDILIPAAKKTIYDMITGGLEMFFYGSTGMSKRGSRMEKVSWRDGNSTGKNVGFTKPTPGYRFADVVFEDRGDAERVLVAIMEYLDIYGSVRVSDLYSAAGLTGNYTDNNYGWEDLRGSKVVMTDDGYMIHVPKPIPLNK